MLVTVREQDCATSKQQAALVQEERYAETSRNSKVKIKSLAPSDKKVKVPIICEKIEGRSVMQHLLLVQIPG